VAVVYHSAAGAGQVIRAHCIVSTAHYHIGRPNKDQADATADGIVGGEHLNDSSILTDSTSYGSNTLIVTILNYRLCLAVFLLLVPASPSMTS
jgi:hypothetical protein